jgi:hypothetical protein
MASTTAFTYQAGARPIEQHPKYRNEANAPMAPCLITVDPRVYRGSTYSKHKPAQPEVQATKPRRKLPSPRSRGTPTNPLIAPPHREVRIDLELQTEPYLQEVVERPEQIERLTQTDAFLDRPPTPPYVPPRTGVDIETQVAEEELFHWDFEVRPIVATIVGKTIEQALMEVHEEEEFANIRRHKEAIEHRRNVDLAEILKLEEGERRKFEEKQRRVDERLLVEAEQHELRARIAARGFGEFFASDLLGDALAALDRRGYFYDEIERSIETTFLPWLGEALGQRPQPWALANAIVARAKSFAVAYEGNLRGTTADAAVARESAECDRRAMRLRQMYVEDRAALRIRVAMDGVKKKQAKNGEEEDESESTA